MSNHRAFFFSVLGRVQVTRRVDAKGDDLQQAAGHRKVLQQMGTLAADRRVEGECGHDREQRQAGVDPGLAAPGPRRETRVAARRIRLEISAASHGQRRYRARCAGDEPHAGASHAGTRIVDARDLYEGRTARSGWSLVRGPAEAIAKCRRPDEIRRALKRRWREAQGYSS